MKEERIANNKKKIAEEQDLLVNYLTRIKGQCRQNRAEELVSERRMERLRPVKRHLELWQSKLSS